MTEHVDELEQVGVELQNEAEKESDPDKRKRLIILAQGYRDRAEQARNGLTIDFDLSPETRPKH